MPEAYANDYREACLVLRTSAKASAALSRRVLQGLLRDALGVAPSNLNSEIDEVIKRDLAPVELAKDLHAVRKLGNWAAHPEKDKATGKITDVEPGEAEAILSVIEALARFCFIARPERDALRADLVRRLDAT
jgi:hypothetical protein